VRPVRRLACEDQHSTCSSGCELQHHDRPNRRASADLPAVDGGTAAAVAVSAGWPWHGRCRGRGPETVGCGKPRSTAGWTKTRDLLRTGGRFE
jgi:hypothetical protein